MKTIDEKFDDEFNIAFYGNRNFIKFTPKEIKQFYNQQIKEMIDKMIGKEELITEEKAFFNGVAVGINGYRKALINIVKEYGFK